MSHVHPRPHRIVPVAVGCNAVLGSSPFEKSRDGFPKSRRLDLPETRIAQSACIQAIRKVGTLTTVVHQACPGLFVVPHISEEID